MKLKHSVVTQLKSSLLTLSAGSLLLASAAHAQNTLLQDRPPMAAAEARAPANAGAAQQPAQQARQQPQQPQTAASQGVEGEGSQAERSGGLITVTEKPTRIIVEQPPAQITVNQAKPQVRVMMQEPDVEVDQAQPRVSVQQSEPEVSVREPQPTIELQSAEPEVELERSDPQVQIRETQQDPALRQQDQAQEAGPPTDERASADRPAGSLSADPAVTAELQTPESSERVESSPNPEGSASAQVSRLAAPETSSDIAAPALAMPRAETADPAEQRRLDQATPRATSTSTSLAGPAAMESQGALEAQEEAQAARADSGARQVYEVPIDALRAARVVDSAGEPVGDVEDVLIKRDGSDAGIIIYTQNEARPGGAYKFAPANELTFIDDAVIWDNGANAESISERSDFDVREYQTAPETNGTLRELVSHQPSGESVSQR